MAKKKHKKRRGHYCWSCQCYLPNEKFSGGGHARHLCKKCSRLGQDELEYRQAVIDIDRCLNFYGRLRRKRRKTFDSFRDHPNERVRRYVGELEARWVVERQLWREMRDLEDIREGKMLARFEALGERDEPDVWLNDSDFDEEDEIPF